MMPETTLVDKTKVQQLTELGMNFIKNQIALAKLSIAETAIISSNKVLNLAIVSVFSLFIVVFMSFGAAFWLGRAFNSMAIGFFIVASIYFVLMVLVLLIAKPLISKQITKLIIEIVDKDNQNG